MYNLQVLLASAVFLGFLHGLGADHLMAIAALSAGPAAEAAPVRRARALWIAIRFAIGHALLLGVGAAALLALGWSLPLVFERTGEMIGGALLIGLGGAGLWALRAGRLYGHTHRHGDEPAAHWHLHVGRPENHPGRRAHSHLPTILGAAFALSSLRALAALAPFGEGVEAVAPGTLVLLVALFGVGILLSMSLFGIAFERLMSAAVAARLGHAAAAVMACTSIALGLFWIVRA